MKNLVLILLALGALGVLVGCGAQPPEGEPVPKVKPVTQEELDSMPPQARQHVQGMQKYGESMQKNSGPKSGQ